MGSVSPYHPLRDPQLERTQPGVETALAIPVAIVDPIGEYTRAGRRRSSLRHRPPLGIFSTASATQLAKNRHYQSSSAARPAPFCRRSSSPQRFAVGCRNASIAGPPDDHPSLTRAPSSMCLGLCARRALTRGFSTTTMDASPADQSRFRQGIRVNDPATPAYWGRHYGWSC